LALPVLYSNRKHRAPHDLRGVSRLHLGQPQEPGQGKLRWLTDIFGTINGLRMFGPDGSLYLA
jgi:hypothetical protein